MTNNQLAENSVIQLLNSVKLARDNAERADNRVDHSFYYALTIALEELQERRKANSEPVIITPPAYPETLPCPVLLEPGLRFGKGVTTNTMLKALQRRANYNSDLDAMTPEQRTEHDANIEAFKAMLPQPAPQED